MTTEKQNYTRALIVLTSLKESRKYTYMLLTSC